MCVCVCVCVCVCRVFSVCVRETEREREFVCVRWCSGVFVRVLGEYVSVCLCACVFVLCAQGWATSQLSNLLCSDFRSSEWSPFVTYTDTF